MALPKVQVVRQSVDDLARQKEKERNNYDY
jgi:hypothetical protein